MSTVKGLIGTLSRQLASRVSRHDLFEREGERAPCPALDPQSLPTEECLVRTVGLADLGAALGPGGGLRIVNHWATWCTGCVEELPDLGRLHRALGERLSFWGISWDRFQAGVSLNQSISEITELMGRHSLGWPTLILDDGVQPEAFFSQLDFECQTVPQTWLVDDSGAVLLRIDGIVDDKAIDALVAKVESLG